MTKSDEGRRDEAVVDDPVQQRLQAETDDGDAVAEYTIDGDAIVFTHTFVPEAARGHGVASRLVEAGLAKARKERLRVVPQCRMFAAYMKKHPETQALLADGGRALLDR